MTGRLPPGVASFGLALAAAAAVGLAAPVRTAKPPQRPGLERGVTLLPNGWKISPAGRHISIGDLPLGMAESPDGRFLAITNNGCTKPSLSVVDLERLYVKSRVTTDNAWLGLAWHPQGDRLFSSGASANTVNEFRFEKERLLVGRTISLKSPEKPGAPTPPSGSGRDTSAFVGGLALLPDGTRLYAVNVLGQTLSAVDLPEGALVKTVPLEAEPYACLVSNDGKTLFVSLWGGARMLLFDARTLEKIGEVPVGEHPNAMVSSRDGSRVFVACANTNEVWSVDVTARAPRERISIALYPKSPPGSTPNALGLSPGGNTLLVANADNNSVAVVDVGDPGSSRVEGFIPTGWYPTAAQFTRDGKRLLILSGKGLTSLANPRGPQPGIPGAEGQSTRDLLQGTLSILPRPDGATLAAFTRTVLALTPYSDATRLSPARAPAGSPVPRRVGGRSPIRHVFYVIRENRTYDQILGDMPEGNGDPNLCLFGEDVTPNAHALAREFVLMDNFYVDAEVSYDGHAFSTGAYATDVVEKIWPMNYAGRGGQYLSEGGGAMRNSYGNLSAPAPGYIWDACVRAGLSVRSYGEFVLDPNPARGRGYPPYAGDFEAGPGPYRAAVPGLEGRIHPFFPPYDLSIPDNRRVDIWAREFHELDAKGTLPALSIIRLGGDHTSYTRAGFPTPRAMIAENDLALGRLVEEISKSRAWKDSAIFVLEDDAQNGPDHVDAHRSVAFVASPYARRRTVDSSLYTTCGMLRTIELILGLPPMSQYDAAGRPMYGAFQSRPVATPYTHREARVALDEMNDPQAYGARASAAADLAEADRVPDIQFNEILWKSVRGAASPMPPPVRAAFVRPIPSEPDRE